MSDEALASPLPAGDQPRSREPLQQLVEHLEEDQRARWQRGERIPVEDYLERHPALRAFADGVVDLVYNEFLLRQREGEASPLEEYLQRFPQLACQLRDQFEVHAALRSSFTFESARHQNKPRPSPTVHDLQFDAPVNLPAVPGYDIIRELGRGGMGVVYWAWQSSLGRPVALKMILAGSHAGPLELARFRTESEAVARLQHPHIVQIYDVGRHDDRPYMALEYVNGGSLAQKLTGTPLPARSAAQFMETVARAVHYAHQQGILHRDLTPANILLGKSEIERGETRMQRISADPIREHPPDPCSSAFYSFTPKITDFGLAKILVGDGRMQTRSGAIMGTPSYMAPEQAAGKTKGAGPATDVYALGAILYEMLTGRPPFRAETPLETLLQVQSVDPVPPSRLQPQLPRDLTTICLKCLQKEAHKRYASAEAFAQDLRRFVQGEPILVRRTPFWERGIKWAKRRPAVAALLAVTSVAALSLLGGTLAHQVQLRAALQTAEDQRQQAQANFEKARQAVDEMLTEVGQKELADLPGVDEVRRKLLFKALTFYQAFLKEKPASLSLRQETGRAQRRVGDICRLLGQHPEADQAYREALDIQTQLVADFPSSADYRHDLAGSLSNLGLLLKVTGKYSEAEQAYRQALEIQSRIAADFPNVVEYQQALAGTHYNLGLLLKNTGKPGKAEQAYRQALDIRTRLAADFPDQPDYRQDVAMTLHDLGVLLKATGQRVEAERAYREALEFQAKLVVDFPGRPDYRRSFASSHNNLANLLKASGRPAEARQAYERAREIQAQLVADFPTRPNYRRDLAHSYYNLGHLLQTTARPQEAKEAYGRAREIQTKLAADFPDRDDYQSDLGSTLHNLAMLLRDEGEVAEARRLLQDDIRCQQAALKINPRHPSYRQLLGNGCWNLVETLMWLGEHAEMAKAVAELSQAFLDKWQDYHRAAGLLARCVILAEEDAKLPPEQRTVVAQVYAEQAIALLWQAFEKGYRNVADLKSAPAFDPLRSRDPFKKLLAELEARVQAGSE
jgi:serine/threonine protein kinase